MKKVFYSVLMLIFLAANLSAQATWSEEASSYTSTIEGGQGLQAKKHISRTPTCSGFIYEQDIALNHFGRKGYAPSEAGGESWKLYDDFPITTTSTINKIILTVVDFDPICSSPEFVINFRSNGGNGTYGQILHTRTIAPDAATYTKDCIIPDWQAEFYYIFNIHIPIAPLTLTPGTYWLEVHSPNQPSFIAGIFWETTTMVQGSRARRELGTTNYNFQNLDFAFALSGSTDMPDSYCVPSIEAVCQNASVTLQPGGQATLNASAVDGGSSGFTNINVSPSTFNCNNLGPNMVTLTVDDGSGNSDNCTATVTVLDDQGLPNSWDANNVGSAPSGNTFNFDACNGTTVSNQFVIAGSGNNATSTMTDNVAFASQTLCGDGSITAKIENVDATGYGGLMIRETTAAGSKQVAVFSNMTSNLRHESRTMNNMPKTVQSFFKPNPFWLRMRRQGMWVHVEYSSNGMMFLPVQSTMVSMQNCVEIGLASFTFLPMGQTSATFSNVSTTGNIMSLTGDDPTTFAVDTELQYDNAVKPNGINLFPNPTTNNFTLQLETPLQEPAMVEIFNLYGQSIAQQRMAEGQTNHEWNTSDWPEGTYTLRLNQTGKASIVKQIVVIR